MSDKTGIEWTDATWNPVRGCSLVSDGCKNCYAMGVAGRFVGPGQPYEGLTTKTSQGAKWNGKIMLVPGILTQPLKWQRPRKIFVNSMSDLFHESVPVEYIDQVFAVMALASHHIFQVLTKRPERMRDYLNAPDRVEAIGWAESTIYEAHGKLTAGAYHGPAHRHETWPLPNVWIGVSVEDQYAANERIPMLLETPAAVRWLSMGPLLGTVDLTDIDDGMAHREIPKELWTSVDSDDSPPAIGLNALTGQRWIRHGYNYDSVRGIDWVVVEGESGPKARPMHPEHVRSLRDQCVDAGVPFLLKQWGEWAPVTELGFGGFEKKPEHIISTKPGYAICMIRYGKKAAGRTLDGQLHDGYPA
ncbi:DUF5131 family protein [Herminiimonas sp. CN]|uniref:DUF5131 family protein n=1 Tax=Herminiimonas sp. CN TaxID=1349818 RepID=UPI00047441D9|nr:phage Gp37/Gp68 family protein [Herminiimonas sp. CN]